MLEFLCEMRFIQKDAFWDCAANSSVAIQVLSSQMCGIASILHIDRFDKFFSGAVRQIHRLRRCHEVPNF